MQSNMKLYSHENSIRITDPLGPLFIPGIN